MHKAIFSLGALVGLLCLCSPAFAKLPIGEILKRSGTQVTVNGKMVKASVPLFWGDRLFAGPDTTLEILVYPAMTLKLQPSTEMKLVGSLLEKAGQSLAVRSVIQLVKGKLQGKVGHQKDLKNDIKIFARKTVSAIRGTTFEIEESAGGDEVGVFEGNIEVTSLEISPDRESPIEVKTGQKAQGKTVSNLTEAPPALIPTEETEKIWDQKSEKILSHHAKEAKKYKKILDQDISSLFSGLRKEIKGMFQSTKGAYDQFKKSNPSR